MKHSPIQILLSHFSRGLAAIALLGLAGLVQAGEKDTSKIDWQPWSDQIFERAQAEHKLVLLDLGAGWCHWCHVMDEITYQDPVVVRLLRSQYLAVRVDQDARPDLANRYEDYGWPATIVFKSDGSELVKRRGYLPPKPMAALLQAIIDDPTPGPSVQPEPEVLAAKDGVLSPEQRSAMRERFLSAYDAKLGGWGDVHKYLNWDAMEYCLTDPDPKLTAMARQTLAAGRSGLIDPVWGGVYQYSTDGDWEHPHFEKIMPFQAENLRVFALAATILRDPEWLKPAEAIHSYLQNFLTSPEGAFYVSQDADLVPGEHSASYFALDDAGRRKLGVPRVDTHIYARENGLAITGLTALYAATGDPNVLAEARRAAEWILAHRTTGGGGFRHDEVDGAGPFLADSLEMGRAFLALYTVTAERLWLTHAEAAATFIDRTFRREPGFASAAARPGEPLPPKPQVDENVALARFTNLLSRQTGETQWQEMASHAMRYPAAPVVVESLGYGTSGLLLADRELTTEPAHLTVVGSKDDPAAQTLFAALLRGAPAYARIEWLDRREGPLPRHEVEFPALPNAAAFVCAQGSCSLPLRTPEQVEHRLAPHR